MKQGSSILYLIGNIINAIGIVLMVILGIICTAGAGSLTEAEIPESYANYTLADYQALVKSMGIFLLVYAVICLIVYILASKARKAVNNDTKELKPHIIMIVIGVIGSNLFYLIGGILGIVSETSSN